jgi:hypothetical protein
MSNAFKIGFAVTIVLIAFLVWRGFVATKGNHLEPIGKIGKVRAQKVDENEVVVVLDFNLRNDADLPMIVRTLEASIDAAGRIRRRTARSSPPPISPTSSATIPTSASNTIRPSRRATN